MDQMKPVASLAPSLLARRGAARPAMRPQVQPLPELAGTEEDLHDLGWNDMGDGADAAEQWPEQWPEQWVAEPIALPVPIVAETLELAPAAPASSRSAARDRKQASRRVTLRLDAESHLQLRLACALENRSAQQLMRQALDEFLANVGGLDGMADVVKAYRRA